MSADWYRKSTNNNPDIIVTLLADGYRAQQVWEHKCNEDRYVSQPPQATNRGSPEHRIREITPSPDDLQSVLSPATQLTFSKPPKNPEIGYLLGSDEKACDMVLGFSDDCISRHMYCISFNEYNEVVMKSWSRNDTEVSYIIKGKIQQAKRKIFTWTFLPEVGSILVDAAQRIKFSVIVPTHTTDKTAYEANCRNFMKLANSASHTLNQLNFSSGLETRPATGTASSHAAPEPPFYLQLEKIGDGGFGVVYKARSMPDGGTVAVKRFKSKSAWSLECNTVRALVKFPHKNIVKFIGFEPGTKPILIMGLAPAGNLEQQHKRMPFTIREVGLILHQMLNALVYLHVSFDMAHRDIKPANILCDSRAHFRLADFGLAKNADDLKTCLGTAPYMAPEMFAKTSYTDAVDLWALGMVVALLLLHEWPPGYQGNEGPSWCAAVVAHYKNYGERSQLKGSSTPEHYELNFLVQQCMLRIKPEERWSAVDCQEEGNLLWGLLDQDNVGSKMPTREDPTGSLPDKRSDSTRPSRDSELVNNCRGRTEENTEVPGRNTLSSGEWESLERRFPIGAANSEINQVRESEYKSGDSGYDGTEEKTEVPGRYTLNSDEWESLERQFPVNAANPQRTEVRFSSAQHFLHAPSGDPSGNTP